jgi:O-antigen/teichoic acid export membrane protein
VNRLKEFYKDRFTRNVFMIAGGTTLAQITNAILTPIVTRIYTPEEYGILTAYISILSIMTISSSLKYEWGIPIADDDEKAVNVLSLCIIVLTIATFILTLLLWIWGDSILELLGSRVLMPYRFFIPFGVFFAGLYGISMQWAFREKDFNNISKTKLTQALAQNISKIGLGLLRFGPSGLILGTILGRSIGVNVLSKSLTKEKKTLLRRISINKILWCARRYINYPLYSATSQLMNTAGTEIPILFMTSLFGGEIVGYYGLANSIIELPSVLIGGAVGDVFYAEAASIGKTNPTRLKELSHKLLKKLIIIGVIPLVMLLLFGPYLFSFVFGSEWYEAGLYSRILSFVVFFRLIFLPISRIFAVMEKQKEALFLDTLRLVLVLSTFLVSKFLSLGSYLTIGIYTVSMSFIYLATYLLAQRIIDGEIREQRGCVSSEH